MEGLATFIPMDRRQAMAKGQDLPTRTRGAALFADISGFTPLTEALVRELGPRRGADELTRQLNRVFGALIDELYRYHGSVIGFSGDAITCWLDGDDGLRATACALDMHQAMEQFSAAETPSGSVISLAMKAAVAAGPVRRFQVGDPQIHCMDVLAGATLDRMAAGEHLAEKGEVVVGPKALAQIADRVRVSTWRSDTETSARYGVVTHLCDRDAATTERWPPLTSEALSEAQLRPWILSPVRERLEAGQGRFLAEMRPVVSLFLRFGGLDFDHDDAAGHKLDAYVRWVQGVLASYDGYLLRLTIGDKGCYLLGTLGALTAHDDDPCRAVAAALDLQSPPPELETAGAVRIGISQGQVRTGAYGGLVRQTYGVQGDEVNLAARLMGVATPGQILLSPHTADRVSENCQLECLGLVRIKGRQQPLPVFAVSGRRLTSQQRTASLFTHPLVGRDKELAQMAQLVEATLSRSGQVLRMEGDAGLGKSHLAAEFVERAACRGLRVAAGVCQSTSQAVPYSPWRQIFRTLLELNQDSVLQQGGPSHEDIEIGHVEAVVRRLNPDWLPRLPLLGNLLGLPIPDTAVTAAFAPQVRQQALFALVVEMMRTWAQSRPLVLLLEDMRWIDEASLDLTVALGRSLAETPILLVLVHRPPVRADKQLAPGLDAMPYYHRLDLSELSPEGVAALVTDRLGHPPSPLALSLVQAMAQGNPFFAEELVDTLQESGALQRQNGEWVLSQSIVRGLRRANCLARSTAPEGGWTLVPNAPLASADLGIPGSIHGVVLSRLDRLPQAHKLSAKVASVIGRVFEFDLLAQSHPVQPEREVLLKQIQEMEARDFTRLEAPEPQLMYMFKHNITQEVIYGTLLEAQQRELHCAIGQALEEMLPDAVERLAHHTYEGQIWPKALTYNMQVGRQAQREYANDIAVTAYRRALKAGEKLGRETNDEQVLAHEALGELMTLLGEYETALEHLASARMWTEVSPPSPEQARYLADLYRKTAEVHERRSDYDQALEWLARGQDALPKEDSEVEAVRLYVLRAGVHQRQGRYEECEEQCRKALAIATQVETSKGQREAAHAYLNLGGCYLRRGDLRQAAHFSQQSAELYQQTDDLAGQSKAFNNLGLAYNGQGDWSQASEAFHRSLSLNREIGAIQEQGFVTNNLGNIYLYRGEWSQAEQSFRESNAIWKQLGAAFPDAVTMSNLGQVHIYQENWVEARACLEHSHAAFREIGSEDWLPELERRWGQYYLGNGALDEALAHTRRSVELAIGHESRLEEGMSCRVLGQIHLARGERALAANALRQSLRILFELNSEYEAAKTRAVLARMDLEPAPVGADPVGASRQEEALAQLDQAIATFERLGAQADLAQALAQKRKNP